MGSDHHEKELKEQEQELLRTYGLTFTHQITELVTTYCYWIYIVVRWTHLYVILYIFVHK